MNIPRIALATLGAFVGYFVIGAALFGLVPSLKTEFLKYPAVYRNQQGQMSHMPAGMAAMFLSMLALAVMYATFYPTGGFSMAEGARSGALFGALIGVFAIGAFVLHRYVNLNIGSKLAAQQSVAYFLEWVVTGLLIGLIYRPVASR